MNSLSPSYLDKLRLTARDGAALHALGAFQARQVLFRNQTPQVLESLRDTAVVESNESSNRIEGVFAPHERIEALVLEGSAPRNRPEEEIAGYRDALNLIHQSAANMEFSSKVTLQLHGLIYRHESTRRGGRWKLTQNEIVERNPDRSIRHVRFVPPGPGETPGMMRDLHLGYAAALDDGREPLIIAPLAVLDFLCIHPFSDGNGRVARLLSLLLLYRSGYEVGRYISLERVVEETRDWYYEALEKSSARWHQCRHNALPWLRYFWSILIRAYKEFEERVGTIRSGRGAKTDIVEHAIARRVGSFSISDIEADSPGVTRDWIRMVMRRLRDEGRIELRGKGRASRWVYR